MKKQKLFIRKFLTGKETCTPLAITVEGKYEPSKPTEDRYMSAADLAVKLTLYLGDRVSDVEAWGVDDVRKLRAGLVKLVRELNTVIAWLDGIIPPAREHEKARQAHNKAVEKALADKNREE